MQDELLGLLGIARRASKLSPGHDAAAASIKKNKSRLCLISSDASERLEKEFAYMIRDKENIRLIRFDYTMDEINFALGFRAGVMSVDDDGFAKRICDILHNGRNDL